MEETAPQKSQKHNHRNKHIVQIYDKCATVKKQQGLEKQGMSFPESETWDQK